MFEDYRVVKQLVTSSGTNATSQCKYTSSDHRRQMEGGKSWWQVSVARFPSRIIRRIKYVKLAMIVVKIIQTVTEVYNDYLLNYLRYNDIE